jgi:hypothetical protein
MRSQAIFLKPYERVIDGIHGWSIVAFKKAPFEQRATKGITYISKYSYTLTINLWLVVLRLKWIGREVKHAS